MSRDDTITKIDEFNQYFDGFPQDQIWRMFCDGVLQRYEGNWMKFEEREPGYLEGMINGFCYIRDTIGDALSVDLLCRIHSAAMGGVIGTNLISRKALGNISEDYESFFYLISGNDNQSNGFFTNLSAEGEKELLEQGSQIGFKAQYDIQRRGVICHGIGNRSINVQMCIEEYQSSLLDTSNDEERLKAIVKLITSLERIHPFLDGNCRVICMLLLNRELIRNGFMPVILDNPNRFDGYSQEECVEEVRKGQENFVKVKEGESCFEPTMPSRLLKPTKEQQRLVLNLGLIAFPEKQADESHHAFYKLYNKLISEHLSQADKIKELKLLTLSDVIPTSQEFFILMKNPNKEVKRVIIELLLEQKVIHKYTISARIFYKIFEDEILKDKVMHYFLINTENLPFNVISELYRISSQEQRISLMENIKIKIREGSDKSIDELFYSDNFSSEMKTEILQVLLEFFINKVDGTAQRKISFDPILLLRLLTTDALEDKQKKAILKKCQEIIYRCAIAEWWFLSGVLSLTKEFKCKEDQRLVIKIFIEGLTKYKIGSANMIMALENTELLSQTKELSQELEDAVTNNLRFFSGDELYILLRYGLYKKEIVSYYKENVNLFVCHLGDIAKEQKEEEKEQKLIDRLMFLDKELIMLIARSDVSEIITTNKILHTLEDRFSKLGNEGESKFREILKTLGNKKLGEMDEETNLMRYRLRYYLPEPKQGMSEYEYECDKSICDVGWFLRCNYFEKTSNHPGVFRPREPLSEVIEVRKILENSSLSSSKINEINGVIRRLKDKVKVSCNSDSTEKFCEALEKFIPVKDEKSSEDKVGTLRGMTTNSER